MVASGGGGGHVPLLPPPPPLGSGTENGYMTILHAISLVYYLMVSSLSFKCIITSYSAIAAMYGPHSIFDFGLCTVIHCNAGGVSLVGQ